MKPQLIKFQFEIRYTNILDFSSIARNIISPYLKLSTNVTITNQGQIEEQIKIDFDNNKLAIDVRWDRIFVYSEGNVIDYLNENSSISIFFSILDQLKKANSFGVIRSYLWQSTAIIANEKDMTSAFEKFREKFIVKNSFNLFDYNDCFIAFESYSSNNIKTITLGPMSEKDLLARNISISSAEIPNDEVFGYLLDLRIVNTENQIVKHSTLKELFAEAVKTMTLLEQFN